MNIPQQESDLSKKLLALLGILVILVLLTITFPNHIVFIIANLLGTGVFVFMAYAILNDKGNTTNLNP